LVKAEVVYDWGVRDVRGGVAGIFSRAPFAAATLVIGVDDARALGLPVRGLRFDSAGPENDH
jgi:hypothetical protein